jgi:sugar/nucleoside kinase (ribokinase family)
VTGSRTLGVIGTLVWDRLVGRYGESAAVEEWGGIGYALGALSVALPDGWRVRPVLELGADLAEEGLAFLGRIPRVDVASVVVVPEANNRVEIRYETDARRCERLTGGVPPWSWSELEPHLVGCDALYVNHISGYEMTLGTARSLADAYAGPVYTDLHSLFLGKDRDGRRVPRMLEAWSEWMRCSHAVQMNEDELELLGGTDDPWARAEGALGSGLGLITVTLGPRGAAYATAAGFDPEPDAWPRRAASTAGAGAGGAGRGTRGTVSEGVEPRVGDPTGCGDVWGATAFARLLAGDGLEDAMAEANRLAGLNVDHRGATGLHEHFERARDVAAASVGEGR